VRGDRAGQGEDARASAGVRVRDVRARE
jgi:hypothetical protein